MVPPLRERLGLATAPEQSAAAVAEARPDTGLMARSLMYLFAAGGAIGLLSLLVSGPQVEVARISVTGACAFGIAFALLVSYDRTPNWAFDALLACGTVLI